MNDSNGIREPFSKLILIEARSFLSVAAKWIHKLTPVFNRPPQYYHRSAMRLTGQHQRWLQRTPRVVGLGVVGVCRLGLLVT